MPIILILVDDYLQKNPLLANLFVKVRQKILTESTIWVDCSLETFRSNIINKKETLS